MEIGRIGMGEDYRFQESENYADIIVCRVKLEKDLQSQKGREGGEVLDFGGFNED